MDSKRERRERHLHKSTNTNRCSGGWSRTAVNDIYDDLIQNFHGTRSTSTDRNPYSNDNIYAYRIILTSTHAWRVGGGDVNVRTDGGCPDGGPPDISETVGACTNRMTVFTSVTPSIPASAEGPADGGGSVEVIAWQH
ncbi:MAG: hypothetical protein ACJAZO_001796 [Myxococcota bacterium]|jgi:hypothetical protein